jgi:hypothetical protein
VVQGLPSLQAITEVDVQEGIGVPAQGVQIMLLSQTSTIRVSFVVQGLLSLQACGTVLLQFGGTA